jgi:hypothetical protein
MCRDPTRVLDQVAAVQGNALSVGGYLLGIIFLTITLASIAAAARSIRQWLLPDWIFPETALVDVLAFLAILLGVCELLGTVGLFRFWFVLSGSVVGAAIVLLVLRTSRPRIVAPIAAGQTKVEPDPYAPSIGIVVTAVVICMWALHTWSSTRGIRSFDSVNYHLPFATRFLQTGHTLPLAYAKPGDETAYDPLNSELFVAFFMMPFHRDVLVPLLNGGWATLALLAAWCIGRTRGIGELTLASVAIILVTPLMMNTNAGQATNDIVAIALLLSSIAILMRAEGRLAAISVAGAAAGLSLGTKLTVVIPLLVLTIGLILMDNRGRRFRAASAWLVPIALTGSYWYVRNLIAIGNPVPTIHIGIGPFSLPSPTFSNVDRVGFTVAHYAFNSRVIHQYVLPGLVHSLGRLWLLTVMLSASGMVLALFARDRLTVVFGIMAIIALAVYTITPTSAAGPPGHPILFSYNTRFAFPALAIGLLLVVLCLAPRLAANARRLLLLAILIALCAEQWPNMALMLALALSVGLALAAASIAHPRARLRHLLRRSARITAVVVVIGSVFAGYFVQRLYLQRRYVNSSFAPDVNHLFAWARGISHARIADDGIDETYPLNGLDLSNYVERIGVHGHSGSFENIRSCVEWRHEIARGHYDYIVTVVGRDAAWSRGPSVAEAFHDRRVIVFKVVAPVDPNACPSRSPPPSVGRQG